MKQLFQKHLLIFLTLFLPFMQQAMAQDVISRVMPQRYLKGIFWKIEKPGLPPSYLLGTVHVDHPEILDLLVRFREQFKSSSVVCTEVQMNYEAMAAELRAMYFSDGRTLKQVINDDVFYRKLVAVASERGLPEASYVSMKPWAIMYMLSIPNSKSVEVLDMKIYTDAQRQGKKVCGLEETNKHTNAFDVFSLKEQVDMLKLTVENIDQFQDMNSQLIKIYLERDLKAMVELIMTSPGMNNKQLITRFIQKLVIDRNLDMLRGMQPHLAKGGGFFAVGAMHLTGEAGLLRLVEGLGYKITLIY